MQDQVSRLYKQEHILFEASRSTLLYEALVKQALKTIHADSGTLFLEKDNHLERKYSTHSKAVPIIIPRKTGFTYEVFTTSKPKLLSKKEVWKIHPEHKAQGFVSFAIIPIAYHNQKKGVLHLSSCKEHFFTSELVTLLDEYCRHAYFLLKNLDAFDALYKSLEHRDLFIAMAAHELKTPLTSIKTYHEILQMKLEKKQFPKLEWTQALNQETDRLIGLINEYLDVKPINNHLLSFKKTEIGLSEIITRAINTVHLTYPNHKFRFINRIQYLPAMAMIDGNKILQVVINILNNAAKFSSEKTVITVKLLSRSSVWVIVVTDKGDGIKPNDLKKVFDRFYKGKTNIKEGMGLGLYLAKNIVKAHNGDIQIASKVGKGTKVTITLQK